VFTASASAAFWRVPAPPITVPLSLFLQLMYLHRLTGALFGLDQIVTYMTMYLAIAPCGSRFSVDALLARRLVGRRERSAVWRFLLPDDSPSVAANVATRLLQLHLCVIYLFGGLSKARGQTWWDGTAVWYALANYEYQSWDMTWLSRYPAIISALSNATLFWEVFYCALVWPRLSRPFVLAIAVAIHASIALFLGMITFGTMMIVANGIFLSPRLFQSREQAESDELAELLDQERAEDAASKVKRQYRALKKREEKYKARVKRLRQREEKIKTLVENRRRRAAGSDDASGDDPSTSSNSS